LALHLPRVRRRLNADAIIGTASAFRATLCVLALVKSLWSLFLC